MKKKTADTSKVENKPNYKMVPPFTTIAKPTKSSLTNIMTK